MHPAAELRREMIEKKPNIGRNIMAVKKIYKIYDKHSVLTLV